MSTAIAGSAEAPVPPAPWRERLVSHWPDLSMVTLLGLVAGLLRFVMLGEPQERYFDEWFYASDACVYVSDEATCGYDAPVSREHPPLAKWLISLAIQAFGFTPTAWRLVPAVLGTLTVVLLYLLARTVGLGRAGSVAAALLLALDPMHVALSRVAMLDVFVTFFVLLAALSAFLAFNSARPNGWHILTGLSVGCAVASKWSGVFIVPVVLVLLLAGVRRRHPGLGPAGTARRALLPVLTVLVALPLLVYVTSFLGRLDGSLLTPPWRSDSWARAFVRRQTFMLRFHLRLEGIYPYLSPPWSWFPLKRPVRMYFIDEGRTYRDILAVGNPVTWWVSLLALAAAFGRTVFRRGSTRTHAELLALGAFGSLYAPWFVFTGQRSFTFAFYVLPLLPFLFLAAGAAVDRAVRTIRGRTVVAVLAAASLAMAAFLAPVVYGNSLAYKSWLSRMLFQDCGPGIGDPDRVQVRPTEKVEGPPSGWCWI